jgi:hypothetical protein
VRLPQDSGKTRPPPLSTTSGLPLRHLLSGSYEPALLLLILFLFPMASAVAVWSAHPPEAPELLAAEATPAT